MPDIFPDESGAGRGPIGDPAMQRAFAVSANRGAAIAGFGKASHPSGRVDLPNVKPTSLQMQDVTRITRFWRQPNASSTEAPQPVSSTSVWRQYLTALAAIKDQLPGAP